MDAWWGLSDGWYWIMLAVAMLLGETLGAAGFLLGAAVAALLVGGALFLLPAIDWRWQVLVFSVLSVVFTWIYWRRFKRFNQTSDRPQLNHRMMQLVGLVLVLPEACEEGESRVQIGDTLWRVRSPNAYPAGTRVRITAVNDMVLSIEKA